MPLIFKDMYVQAQISTMTVMDALNTCIARIDGNQATAALQRWFGDSSAVFAKEMSKKLSRFKSIINLQDISVGFMDLGERDRTTNAAALPGSVTSIVPGSTTDYKGRNVLLDVAFHTLPKLLPLNGGVADASFYSQSKFETVIHELSHAILSTNDELLTNGSTAYGTQNALALVGESVALAKTNAENFGIFVEVCGIHKTS